MTIEEIKKICTAFLVEDFEVEEEVIEDDAVLQEALELDSLDYVDLVVVIQREFGFKPAPEDFRTMTTFTDFYNYIQNKMK